MADTSCGLGVPLALQNFLIAPSSHLLPRISAKKTAGLESPFTFSGFRYRVTSPNSGASMMARSSAGAQPLRLLLSCLALLLIMSGVLFPQASSFVAGRPVELMAKSLGYTNYYRGLLLDAHNYYRSQEAQHGTTDARGYASKGAAFMLRLNYDLMAEQYARNYALALCRRDPGAPGEYRHSKRGSPKAQRVYRSENIYTNTKNYSNSPSKFDAVHAVFKWYDERRMVNWKANDFGRTPSREVSKATGTLQSSYT
eukprot:GHVT01103592.1.p2 GENE.GHVT01103592.1~~GHVT01103592.1.p2  ORF type:complete len:255 (+),score=36.68 GHVT01103592.1:2619-3383(+)